MQHVLLLAVKDDIQRIKPEGRDGATRADESDLPFHATPDRKNQSKPAEAIAVIVFTRVRISHYAAEKWSFGPVAALQHSLRTLTASIHWDAFNPAIVEERR
jgi:hypothetical protein